MYRVAALDLSESKSDEALNFTAYNEAFARAYAQLVNGQTVRCAHSGQEFGPIRSPDAVIMDVSQFDISSRDTFLTMKIVLLRSGIRSCPCFESETRESVGMDGLSSNLPHISLCSR